MATHERPESAANPGYERRDVKISVLVWLGLTVLLGTAAIFVFLWFMLAVLQRRAQRSDPEPSPLAHVQPPPGPHLQETPVEDLQTLIERDETILTTYGWADEEKTSVRIPVSRAMELALERGLQKPRPKQEPQTPPTGQE